MTLPISSRETPKTPKAELGKAKKCLYNVLHPFLTAKSPWKGQRLIQGPASSGVKRTPPFREGKVSRQFLAQSFLRGRGTPVSALQIPVM